MLPTFALLLVFQLLGEALVRVLRLPLPGPLIGMVLLFGFLVVRGAVPDVMRESANGILRHLMLLFIPAVAGVVMHLERIGHEWLAFVMSCIVGTAITLAVTALTLKALLRRSDTPLE